MAAVAPGTRNIKYLADAPANAYKGARHAIVQQRRPFIYLALSGGGGGGAYGAGILNGWTQSGARPEFTTVSGVSTGALIAPFAFLGPDYDERLKQIYTSGDAENLIGQPNPLGPIFGAGLFDSGRLRELVEHYLDDDIINAIARQDKKGRRPLSTLRLRPRGCRRMTRGQCGSLHLHCKRLALSTPCRSSRRTEIADPATGRI
jgi:hypothetical protein